MVVSLPHPHEEQLRMIGCPIKLSDTPITYNQPPPLLGEHTVQVLSKLLGYSDTKIAQLDADGIIKTGDRE
jgi:crotonobetainyl-CoA:carnitine CoA-transferase CaiB-like acyl-CoA transferase